MDHGTVSVPWLASSTTTSPTIVDHVGVIAGAAGDGVVAGAAVEGVVAGAAVEQIVAASAVEDLRLAADAVVGHEVVELGAGDRLRRVIGGEDADSTGGAVDGVGTINDGANVEITLGHGDADMARAAIREGVAGDAVGPGPAVESQRRPTMAVKVLPVMVAAVPCSNDTPSFQPVIRLLLMVRPVMLAPASVSRAKVSATPGPCSTELVMVTLLALTWTASRLPKARAPVVIMTPSMTTPAPPVISKPPLMTDSAERCRACTPWLAPRMVTALSTTMSSS